MNGEQIANGVAEIDRLIARSQTLASAYRATRLSRLVAKTQKLLYLNHDIAFPSPTLAKAGDGAVHGLTTNFSTLSAQTDRHLRGLEPLRHRFVS